MKLKTTLFLMLLLSASAAVTAAGDIAAGKARASSCMSCHGSMGISANPAWPNLAGQKRLYLQKQLQDFRDGKRQDPTMSAMAKALTDNDISNLAAYYSSLK